jgi:hypothetical protein
LDNENIIIIFSRKLEMARTKVSLQWIWSSHAVEILIELKEGITSDGKGGNSLINKVKLAQIYLKSGGLTEEAAIIVSHHLFKTIALSPSGGRLDNIIAKITLLLTLEALFNEIHLGSLLETYMADDMLPTKLYIFTSNGLEVRDINDLSVIEKIIKVEGKFDSPYYYKGKIYCCSSSPQRSIVSIDVDSGDLKIIISDLYRGMIEGKAGHFLYFQYRYLIFSINLETLEVVPTSFDTKMLIFYRNSMIYTISQRTLFTYDAAVSPLKLLSKKDFPDKSCIVESYIVGDEWMSMGPDTEILDLKTLEIKETIPSIRGNYHMEGYRYGHKLYINSGPDNHTRSLMVYDRKASKFLSTLIETFNDDYEEVVIHGNKLLYIYQDLQGGWLDVYDLDTDKQINHIPIAVKLAIDSSVIG